MSEKPIYALSLQPPWGLLICKNLKDCENRDWYSKFTGEVYIHQSKTWDKDAMDTIMRIDYDVWKWLLERQEQAHWYGIIGKATFGKCQNYIKSKWFFGKFAYLCSDGVLFDKPISCKGKLGFFKPEISEDNK